MTAALKPVVLPILRDVADRRVYLVQQRAGGYVLNDRTGRRITRNLRPLLAGRLVYLTDRSRDGHTVDYDLTTAGRRVLDTHPEEQP